MRRFKIEAKTSKSFRSNKTLLRYLAKVHKSLKFFPHVKRLVPELFKHPTPLCQWDSKIYHPAQQTARSTVKHCVTFCNTVFLPWGALSPTRCPWLLNHYVSSCSRYLQATRNTALVMPYWEGPLDTGIKSRWKKSLKFC